MARETRSDQDSGGEAAAVAVAVQEAAPGLVRTLDSEDATRFEAALEALAPNTRRAYGSALAAWERWAALQGVDALAASPFVLRVYLQERAHEGAGISSLRLTVAALRKVQALAGVEPTAHDQVVTDTISGLARQAHAPRQAYALTAEALAVIAATACQPRVGRGGKLESTEQARRRGLVDIALCRVLSDAGLRRSEAAALSWDDFARWDDGSGRLTVGRSKTDAEARTVYLTPASVAALRAIRPAGAPGADSVFGLSAASISRRIRAAAAVAGLGPGFSGHSGRVGMARRMAAAGAPTHEIMAQGRWKTARMVELYTRAEEAGRAAKWLE
ncbi:MAG: tyrosine-type recombinase/integrase [Caldilineaceae bacterium]|nr:tyrosine-type recombinase/integrase [Caldilineaceae bacterium]MDE0338853.1 tyrosine-type recombinase/integrase [Caldilineaceae bacterium]